jgi:ABC-2 type transport system permease protein
MFAIAARELRSLFLSPLAWVILAVVQLIVGYIFLANLDVFLQVQGELPPNAPGFTDLVIGNLFASAALVLLLVVPLLTMRLIAEERRNRTLPLLLAAPLSTGAIVLGKYLGLMGFLCVLLAGLALMPLSLLAGGTLDLGQTAAGLLGLLLLLGTFGAIGLLMSSLTAQPAIAAVGTFGVLLLLWIIDWSLDETGQSGLLAYLSMFQHYQALLKGLFSSADVIYYLLLIGVCLILSVRRLEAERI